LDDKEERGVPVTSIGPRDLCHLRELVLKWASGQEYGSIAVVCRVVTRDFDEYRWRLDTMSASPRRRIPPLRPWKGRRHARIPTLAFPTNAFATNISSHIVLVPAIITTTTTTPATIISAVSPTPVVVAP